MNLLLKPVVGVRWFVAMLCLAAVTNIGAQAGDMKLEAQLIWGTNDANSPDPKHKPVDADVKKRLGDLPLKWKNYFEVNRKLFGVPEGGSRKVAMSKKCELEVKHLKGGSVEVSLVGKGEKRTQPLPKGEILVLGGNAPNSTAWLITLKRIQ
jgi:hypothetical protein